MHRKIYLLILLCFGHIHQVCSAASINEFAFNSESGGCISPLTDPDILDDFNDINIPLSEVFSPRLDQSQLLFTSEELFMRSARLKFKLEKSRSDKKLDWSVWIYTFILQDAASRAAAMIKQLPKNQPKEAFSQQKRDIETMLHIESIKLIVRVALLEKSLDEKIAFMIQRRREELATKRRIQEIRSENNYIF